MKGVGRIYQRNRTGYVDNSLPRVLTHTHRATTTALSLRNPMVDSLGGFDEEFEDAQSRDMAELVASGLGLEPVGDGTVVPFAAKVAWGRMNAKFQWKPTPADITRIVHAIWPEAAGRPIKRPQTITGAKKNLRL